MNMRFYKFRDKLDKWMQVAPRHPMTFAEWTKYYDDLKAERPVAYFITKTLPGYVENIFDPFYSLKRIIKSKFFTRTSLIDTGLNRNIYHEIDERMLHGIFNLLTDYVEVELASLHVCGYADDEYDVRQKYNYPNWYFWWTKWRSPEAGLDYLAWEEKLVYDDYENDELAGKPTPQAVKAMEVHELYNWWKNIRPNRLSAWTEYNEYIEKYPETKNNRSKEPEVFRGIFERMDALEKVYYDEDTEMLYRVIKIRQNLWS